MTLTGRLTSDRLGGTSSFRMRLRRCSHPRVSIILLCVNVAVLGLGITSILGAQGVNETTDVLLSPDVQRYRAAVHLGSKGDLRRAKDELDTVLRRDINRSSSTRRAV